MSEGSYDYKSYLSYLVISEQKHLLVEGKDDKRLFTDIFYDFDLDEKIQIETVEQISDFPMDENLVENRQKVEFVCRQTKSELFGFVDREFREFDIENRIIDKICDHKVDENILWSRGHSIENYCFSFESYKNPLRAQTLDDSYIEAIETYENIFSEILRCACILSYVAWRLGFINQLNQDYYHEILTYQNSLFNLDFDKLFYLLSERGVSVDEEKYQSTIAQAQDLLKRTDKETIRWFVHGHIGLEFLWTSYQVVLVDCIAKNGKKNPQKYAQQVAKLDISQRFYSCLAEWFKQLDAYEFICKIKEFCGIDDEGET